MFDRIYHQFEIRYAPILNFDTFAKEMLSPYLGMSESYGITNENTQKQKIDINFDGGYSLSVFNDKIAIRITNDIKNLSEAGSVISEPFFSIVNKIKTCSGFSKFNGALYYSICINENLEYTNEIFSDTFFNSVNNILNNHTDSRVTLEFKKGTNYDLLNFAPFIGEEDLKKFNFPFSDQNIAKYKNSKGLITDLTVAIDSISDFNLNTYKELETTSNNILKRLWEQYQKR